MMERENYYALLLSVEKSWTPDKAVAVMEGGDPVHDTAITPEDVAEMSRLQEEGHTYPEIGQTFGMSPRAAYGRIMRWRRGAGNAK